MSDEDIVNFCRQNIDAEDLPEKLVALAVERESKDDCSVVICRFRWSGDEEDSGDGAISDAWLRDDPEDDPDGETSQAPPGS